jgi:hypothetical protein
VDAHAGEPFVEEVRRLAQQVRIIVEVPEPAVAIVAEQRAHLVEEMAMIDAEPPVAFPLAEPADPVLRGQHPVIVSGGESVLEP